MTTAEREQLFQDIFSRMKEKIFRLCYGYLYDKDEVEDLFQEVLINIWNNLHTFRGEAHIHTWLYRVAVNTALLYNRQTIKRRMRFSSLDTEDVVEVSSELATDPFLPIDELRRCIRRLPEQERIIITLVLEGMSYQEISDIVGISANYVGVKINRIKQNLEMQWKGWPS